jgi:hypothetical protein
MARGAHASRAIVLLATWCLASACGSDTAVSAAPITYTAELRGTNEVPVIGTSAAGTATLRLSGSVVSYEVVASGFTTTLTVGHIQIGGAGIIGPSIVALPIVAQSGTVSTGTIDLSVPVTFNTVTISGDSLRTLLETGQAYVNLHTAAAPGGEIRGQIVRR